MSGSPHSRKLLKNRHGLTEAVQHLRPRGSYDPLPPPGGYPLPACIRRKFSFAPQLPSISLISLLPDFASSSSNLGVQLDELGAKSITNETPTSLYIRYSLESLRNTVEEQLPATKPKPLLPRINTNIPAVLQHNDSRRPRDTVYAALLDDLGLKTSQSLRRKRGRESLYRLAASSPKSSQYSASPSLTPSTEDLGPCTSRTSLVLSEEDIFTSTIKTIQRARDAASLDPKFSELDARLLERLARDTPNLFGSFFIIDLQLPDNPVRITSHDMIPVDLGPGEAIFLDEANMDIPYHLKTVFYGDSFIRSLPFEGDLVDSRRHSAGPSLRFYGQIDLTEFLDKEFDDNVDIWLEIAYEEMAKVRREMPPYPVPPYVEAKGVPDLIKLLHRDYFIIGLSDTAKLEFGITMVSPSLAASIEIHDADFLDWTSLRERLVKPQRFVTQVYWQSFGHKDKLYCIPMFGPGLVCWLCFLVDKDLPAIWPSTGKATKRVGPYLFSA